MFKYVNINIHACIYAHTHKHAPTLDSRRFGVSTHTGRRARTRIHIQTHTYTPTQTLIHTTQWNLVCVAHAHIHTHTPDISFEGPRSFFLSRPRMENSHSKHHELLVCRIVRFTGFYCWKQYFSTLAWGYFGSNPYLFELTGFRPESNRGPADDPNLSSPTLFSTELWWRMHHRRSFRTLSIISILTVLS